MDKQSESTAARRIVDSIEEGLKKGELSDADLDFIRTFVNTRNAVVAVTADAVQTEGGGLEGVENLEPKVLELANFLIGRRDLSPDEVIEKAKNFGLGASNLRVLPEGGAIIEKVILTPSGADYSYVLPVTQKTREHDKWGDRSLYRDESQASGASMAPVWLIEKVISPAKVDFDGAVIREGVVQCRY